MSTSAVLAPGMVPVITPDGQPGSIPVANLSDALSKGFKKASAMTSPDGTFGLIPQDKAGEAVKQGFTAGQPTPQLNSAANPDASKGILGHVWDWANKGLISGEKLTNLLATGAPRPADMQPNETPYQYLRRNQTYINPDHPYLAAIRAGLSGATADTMDTAADFTSPVSLATLAGGEAEKIPGTVGKIAKVGSKAAAAVFGGEGAAHVAHAVVDSDAAPADRLKEGLQGAGQAILGASQAPGSADAAADAASLAKTGASKVANAATKTASYIADTAGDVRDVAKDIVTPASSLTPTEAATKAFRPRNSKANWNDEISSALPDMRRSADMMGIDPTQITPQQALDTVNHAKKQVWSELKQNYTDPIAAEKVDTSPVADAIRNTISDRTTEQNPAFADKINKIADTYDGRDLSVEQLEDRVKELNNETRSIEARFGVDRRAAMLAPENAPVFAERDGLRNLLLDKVDELSGPGAADLRRRYGALTSVEDVISRRLPVIERQAPVSFPQRLTRMAAAGKVAKGAIKLDLGEMLEGLTNFAQGRKADLLNDPDYLTQRAFQGTTPRPAPVERINDPEYITDPDPEQLPGDNPLSPRALPPGRYAGIPSSIFPRALPEKAGHIPLPAELPQPNNAVETVGVSPARESAVLQAHVDKKGNSPKLPWKSNTKTTPESSPITWPVPRALPEKAGHIPLPAQFPTPSNSVETVGIAPGREASALQAHFDKKNKHADIGFVSEKDAAH